MLQRLSPRRRALLGVAIIALVVFLALRYAPPEGEANNTTGDLAETPTVVVTNGLDSRDINRQLEYQGAQLTVEKVMQAKQFSDDRSRKGAYTLRVLLTAKNQDAQVLGIDFAKQVQLVLPGGQTTSTKRISVKIALLPRTETSGFLDFPLERPVSLSALKLQFKDGPLVSF